MARLWWEDLPKQEALLLRALTPCDSRSTSATPELPGATSQPSPPTPQSCLVTYCPLHSPPPQDMPSHCSLSSPRLENAQCHTITLAGTYLPACWPGSLLSSSSVSRSLALYAPADFWELLACSSLHYLCRVATLLSVLLAKLPAINQGDPQDLRKLRMKLDLCLPCSQT